jgi:uncharacterized membrane protein
MTRYRSALAILMLPGWALLLGVADRSGAAARRPAAAKSSSGKPSLYTKQITPLLHKYCWECHGAARANAGIRFSAFRDEAAVGKAHETWSRVSQILQSGAMPPKDKPQPTSAERNLLINWIDVTLSTAQCDVRDPGRVTGHGRSL